jgi:hypothetical protein
MTRRPASTPASIGAIAATTARKQSEMAYASGQVIAARLGIAGSPLVNTPGGAAEMARMVPEKAEAFAAAGAGAVHHMGKIAVHSGAELMRETAMATQATLAMAYAKNPISMLATQQRYMIGWFGRAIQQTMELTEATTRMQAAMLHPVHKTATANARRLKG